MPSTKVKRQKLFQLMRPTAKKSQLKGLKEDIAKLSVSELDQSIAVFETLAQQR